MLKYFLLGIILAGHIFLASMFWFGDNLRKSTVAEEAEAPVAPAPELSGGSSGASGAVPGPTGAAAAELPLFSDDYFTPAGLTPPAALLKSTEVCQAAGVFTLPDRRLLWGKKVESVYPIASLTKMMTSLLVMEEIHQGSAGITLQTPVRVSKNATRIGTRQVWLDPRETFTVDELLKCVLIRSANDCAFLLGEFLGGGSHEEFVKRMNNRARQLGCRRFVFNNAHGLPHGREGQENQGCILELAYLAERLWQYPEVMKWTATWQEYIRENTQKPFQLDSTNRLLRSCPGVNGMKTGMTDQAGYCLVATCEREQGRVVAVVMGVKGRGGDKVRDEIARQLIEWAYASQAGDAP